LRVDEIKLAAKNFRRTIFLTYFLNLGNAAEPA
jgi:hypothetical protein